MKKSIHGFLSLDLAKRASKTKVLHVRKSSLPVVAGRLAAHSPNLKIDRH
jgi:hypothetical protein